MIKITVTNILNDYEQKAELLRIIHTNDAYSCISDMGRFLRNAEKYGILPGFKSNTEITKEQIEIVEYIRYQFYEITKDLPEID